jgi:two-component system, response regulator YesN
MIKVIIVDDEKNICLLIKKTINWESLGYVVIGEANDGLTAFNMIREQKPDLVVCDIRLPIMNGIELIETIRKQRVDIEFIFVSGYNDVEYLKGAITYNAFEYILKPIDIQSFTQILIKAAEKIKGKYIIRDKLDYLRLNMLMQSLNKILQNNAFISIETLNEEFGTSFKPTYFCIVIFKLDSKVLPLPHAVEYEFQKLINGFRAYYSGDFYEIAVLEREGNLQCTLLINTENNDSEFVKKKLTQFLDKYLSMNDSFFSQTLTIGLGDMVNDITEIKKSYDSAMASIKSRVVYGVNRIIDFKDTYTDSEHAANILSPRENQKLTTLFDVFDAKHAAVEISKLFNTNAPEYIDNPLIYHMISYEIIEIMFNSFLKKDIKLKNNIYYNKSNFMAKIDNCFSYEQMETLIVNIFNRFVKEYAIMRQKNGEKVIGEIKVYVANNYREDITLHDVARHVGLTPSYISSLFRMKTGENFSQYLINYRIEMSKDLLKDVQYKIADIAAMSGYKDPKHFTRTFKKIVGVNPTDYRKLYI